MRATSVLVAVPDVVQHCSRPVPTRAGDGEDRDDAPPVEREPASAHSPAPGYLTRRRRTSRPANGVRALLLLVTFGGARGRSRTRAPSTPSKTKK